MDEFTNSSIQIVLRIIEGRGFDQILHPTLLTATLNGHTLETDLIQQSANPQYTTDLVWESEKNALRKMRASHAPLKIECFAVKDDGSKEKIGYILLSIRSAQVIPDNKEISAKTSWQKLLGLKNDIKTHKPELFLALSVESRENVPQSSSVEKNVEKQNLAVDSQDTITPSLLHVERLIQLGPLKTCHDLFLLSVSANYAGNLNLLLPDNLDKSLQDTLNISYKILENDVQLKPFKRNYSDVWTINEKIVVRIRSSLSVLKNYLQRQPYLHVLLTYKNAIIGHSELDLQPLIPADNIQDFLKNSGGTSTFLDQRCFFYKPEASQSTIEQKRPYLDLQLKLQYAGAKMDIASQENHNLLDSKNYNMYKSAENPIEEYQNNVDQPRITEIGLHRNPAGDFGKYTSGMTCMLNSFNECRYAHKSSLSCEVIKNQAFDVTSSQSASAVLCSCNKDYSKSVEAYHCYCLNICLTAVKLSSSRLTIRNIEFRFHHPKAEIMSTVHPKMPVSSGEKVKLQDIGCKLHFISSTDEIKQLLLSFPPKISICDVEDDNTVCISQAVVDIKQLFGQNKPSCQYEIPLYDMEQNKIGDLDIALNLEDLGPYYRTKRRTSGENLGPPILDDTLAYKIVDELETWKERQKQIFKIELKRKEERHLNLLSEEWQQRREDLESKLACSVEQCKMLANSLNNATEDLRTRRLKSLEKEARLVKANEDLQWRYETMLQELRESSHIAQKDLTSKVAILEERKTALEAQVESLTVENEKLNALVTKQAEELEVYQKASLTQDQTASLLQELKTLEEKLNSAQKSKTFFKEQWGKAVREIHRMQMEHQQAMEVQIKNSKEELKNLDLEEILCTDSTALSNDQILLDQIQKEIEVIKPKPTFGSKDQYDQIFAPINNVCPKQFHANDNISSNKSEEYDERLRTLIEERDALLKTGSYSMDDGVIVKLNTEIRTLLMNS